MSQLHCLFSSAKTGTGSAGLVAVTTVSCSRASSGHEVSSKWKITYSIIILLIIHFWGICSNILSNVRNKWYFTSFYFSSYHARS